MRIGIVGSGIGGLAAAYWLDRQGHRVTLFECHDSLGMAAHEIQVPLGGGLVGRGDVPTRMFNHPLWPNLLALYRELGVEIVPVKPSQCFCEMDGQEYLNLETAYRPWQLVKSVLNQKSRLILRDAKRLLEQGAADLARGIEVDLTFGKYLADHQYSNEFKFGFIFPTLSSTVCTCSYQALEQYPAVVILDTLRKLTSAGPGDSERPLLWKTKNGTVDVAERLARKLPDVRLGQQVGSIVREQDQVIVRHHDRGSTNQGTAAVFDHVVLATQANTALRLVNSLSEREHRMLSQFHYEEIVIKIHRDASFMPANRSRWTTFNQFVRDSNESGPEAMCTVFMNQFHSDWAPADPVFQTIGPIVPVSESVTLATINLQRPVVNESSWRGWELRDRLHREVDRRIWYCGSYASPGVPLLETAINSVLDLRLLKEDGCQVPH